MVAPARHRDQAGQRGRRRPRRRPLRLHDGHPATDRSTRPRASTARSRRPSDSCSRGARPATATTTHRSSPSSSASSATAGEHDVPPLGIDGQPGDENVYDGWDSAFDMLAEQLAGGDRLMGRLTVEQIVSVDGYAADARRRHRLLRGRRRGRLQRRRPARVPRATSTRSCSARTRTGCSPSYWPTADPEVERVAEPINRLPKFVVSNTLDSAPWGDGRDRGPPRRRGRTCCSGSICRRRSS